MKINWDYKSIIT